MVKTRLVLALAGALALGCMGCGQSASETTQTEATELEETAKGAIIMDPSMQPKFSASECIAIAYDAAPPTGQSTGEPYNAVAEGPIVGGGTVYYLVDFDLGAAHYHVMVDAIGGNIVNATMTVDGIQQVVDIEGAAPADPSMQPKYSANECIAIAYDVAPPTGQSTGEPYNAVAEGPIVGGGTVYYLVDFDLGAAHYHVMVDAIGGYVVNATMNVDGIEYVLDAAGNEIARYDQSGNLIETASD